LETLAHGFGLAEGPCAARDGSVYFSDVLGGGVYRWSPGGGVSTVIAKRRGVGGIVLHRDGGVVVSGRDVLHVDEGRSRVLLTIEGVTGFNDMAADGAGLLYAGALRFSPFAGESPVPGEIWRIDAEGRATVLFDGIEWPNGIAFSPDGRTIYSADYSSGRVLAHALGDAGETRGRRVFAQSPSGAADGLAVDAEGGVWVALGDGGGVARFRPDGELDRVLDVPASFVSSVCFGGSDLRDLYITTAADGDDPSVSGALLRARVEVPGLPAGLTAA
jgi:sugar lactone lactonase YvrE